MPLGSQFFETVARNTGDRQPDTVNISRFREVRLLGGRHAELGGGNEQGTHVRPAKAATCGARYWHWQGLGQDAVTVVPEQAAAVELADPKAALRVQRKAVRAAQFGRCLGKHCHLFQVTAVGRVTGAVNGTGH